MYSDAPDDDGRVGYTAKIYAFLSSPVGYTGGREFFVSLSVSVERIVVGSATPEVI